MRVCARIQAVRRVHTRKLGVHINVPTKNAFAHILYTSFQIQASPGKMLQKRNSMRAHTLKIRGNIGQERQRDKVVEKQNLFSTKDPVLP